MKKTFFIIFCLLTGFLSAQNINNVTIKTTLKGANFDGQITWFLKGDKIAFDVQFTNEGKQYLTRYIPDKVKGIFHILSTTPESKIYSTAEAKLIEPTPGFDSHIISIEQVKDEVISGINCKKIIVKTAGSVTECYIDPTINANYTSYESFFRSDYALLAMKELKMTTGFPIAIKTVDLEGKVITEVQTLNIQANSVTDNVFNISKDYKPIEDFNKAPVKK